MTEKPEVKIRVSPAGIPSELKVLPRWVLWKHTWSRKTQRWGKVPYQCSGAKAESDNPATWCSFDEAVGAMDHYDGIGFVFNGDGITGIDLDHAVDDCGVWSDSADKILKEIPGYAELSPSGTGLHIITRAEHIGDGKRKNGIEAYSTGRYFTFTGSQLNGHAGIPSDLQDIKPFLARAFGATLAEDRTDLDIAIAETPRTFYQKVNALAMKAFGAWVPALFPAAIPYKQGGYRVTSESLGRHLEEDISIVPSGIKDFGVADQDDPRTGKRSPIDLVIEWGDAKNAADAANWLCKQLLVDPVAMGGKEQMPVHENIAFIPAAQFASDQKVEWHVKHIIQKRGLVVIYGDPGSSKSFFALDLVAHVARGLPWRGYRVRQSRVAYIAAEGVVGFGNRLAAYARYHDVPLTDLPVLVRGGSFDLKKQYLDISAQINEMGGIGIVVIDTLAAVTAGGNENTSEDMGAAVDAAQRIIENTGCTVILIHHTNKGGEIRGWSGLPAALDNKIRIERKGDLRTAHIEKQKEGRDGQAFGYRLAIVDLYVDEDGDQVTSCAVEEIEETTPNTLTEKKERAPRGGHFESSASFRQARAYLETIEELIEASPRKEITMKEAIAGIQASPKHSSGLENHPDRSNIRKTIEKLTDRCKVTLELGVIRLPDDVGDLG